MCMAGVLAATPARLRYPSPSTCRAAGRHTDNLPDGILGGDTPWARGFAPFAHAKGLCACGFSAQAMVAVSVRRRPARILTVIVGNPGLRRSIDRLSSSRGRLKEDAMRSIVLGAIVAAGLSLVSAVPTVSAPANVAADRASGGGHRNREVRCAAGALGAGGAAIAVAGAAGNATLRSSRGHLCLR